MQEGAYKHQNAYSTKLLIHFYMRGLIYLPAYSLAALAPHKDKQGMIKLVYIIYICILCPSKGQAQYDHKVEQEVANLTT